MKSAKHPSGLNNYVGYAEIREAMGIAPRTVQQMVRDGEFPQPVRLPGRVGGPAAFSVAEVNAWDEARQTHRRTHLQALAVADPADLAPDALEGEARNLAALALSKRTGRDVDASKLSLHLGEQIAPDEFMAAEMKEHDIRAAAMAELTAVDAAVIAAALLPSLRHALARAYPELRDLLRAKGGLQVEFTRISDFFKLFELTSRLSDLGYKIPPGVSAVEHLAEFEFGRATLVAAWLFPSLRNAYANEAEESDQPVFADDELFREFVSAALDDAQWPEAEARLLATQRSIRDAAH